MLFKKKNKVLPIPQGFTAEDIRVESSTCTGERTIGFFSTAENRLMYAELVTRDEDIEKFYEKYGLAKA
jgi:hypothetical protein